MSGGLPDHLRYLDIAAGLGRNSIAFSISFKDIYCLDINLRLHSDATSLNNLHAIQASAEILPFHDEVFDLVSMFSLIEHVSHPTRVISEAIRVLKPQGELIIQVPNRYSIVEPHIGLPNPVFIPSFLRWKVLKIAGYSWWIGNANTPSKKRLKELILSVYSTPEAMKESKIVYPPEYIPRRFRLVYRVLYYIGLFRLLPLSYMFVLTKTGAK